MFLQQYAARLSSCLIVHVNLGAEMQTIVRAPAQPIVYTRVINDAKECTFELTSGVWQILDLSGFYHTWHVSKLIIRPDKSPKNASIQLTFVRRWQSCKVTR